MTHEYDLGALGLLPPPVPPRASLPPPPDPLAVFVAAADTAARVGWVATVATARLWLAWGAAVLDAVERAGERR